jgi:hypothetical protein
MRSLAVVRDGMKRLTKARARKLITAPVGHD